MAEGSIRINCPVNERGAGYVTVSQEVFRYLQASGFVCVRNSETNEGLRLYRDEMEG